MRFDVITKTLPANLALLAVQREAAAAIEAKTAQSQDSAMIERDLSRGACPPEPAAEDPLAAVRDAIDELRAAAFECALDEVQNTRRDPDYTRADAAEAKLIDEMRKLLAPTATVEKINIAPDNGLLTSHNPDRRVL